MTGDAAWTSSSAAFSSCRRYRYQLWRRWEEGSGTVAFIGLNPSTAHETEDDRTIGRCIGFAKRWGYRELLMLNLFAFQTKDPETMKAAQDPIGPDNDRHLVDGASRAQTIVAAWGAHGIFQGRSHAVQSMLPNLHVLRLTKAGQPRHPLYLPGDLTPVPWNPPR